MTKSTIRVAIDVGSKSHWVGVGLSEGQVLERFSIAHNQKGFEHFFRRVELHRQRLERLGPALGSADSATGLQVVECQ